MDQLINYEEEIAFIGGRKEFNLLFNSKELFKDKMLFILHKDHKFTSKNTTLTEIVRESFVFQEKGSSSREKLVSLCKIYNVNKPIVGLQINGFNETIRTVIEGNGVTFVSSLEVNEYIARGDVDTECR
ncbi:LysR family transcriptional regulator substrate-binding protein [Peribacillus simplex]|uniref:LysR family transcriptional regulator substrate-binding protein n=1 Tax=Peribacillus simplex TaxID=1478 RepID=UPI0025473A24|nr:LysR family transcriptional regulator substrate-binding protein [Peribacillus simplex]